MIKSFTKQLQSYSKLLSIPFPSTSINRYASTQIKVNEFYHPVSSHSLAELEEHMAHPLDDQLWMYEVAKGKVSYFLKSEEANCLIAIDPGDPQVSLYQCQLLEEELKCELKYIFITHEHESHSSGVQSLKKYKDNNLKVFCSKYGPKIKGANYLINYRAEIKIGELIINSLHTPGHTNSSMSYCVYRQDFRNSLTDPVYNDLHPDNILELKRDKVKLLNNGTYFDVYDKDPGPLVFVGDTLTPGGIGYMFGSALAYVTTLSQLLSLPFNSKIFCGDLNAVENLQFMMSLDPKNQFLRDLRDYFEEIENDGELIAGNLLAIEMQYNPYLMISQEKISQITGVQEPDQIIIQLNRFKELGQWRKYVSELK